MKTTEITNETRAHDDLFNGESFLSRIDTEDLPLKPLSQGYALWYNQHIQNIAREDEDVMEEFPDAMTAGIVDTKTQRAVAYIMWEDGSDAPFPDSVVISQVETDPALRGKGIAAYLYNLVRKQHTIVSDQDQTGGGQAMWVNLAKSGVPVQGWVQFGTGRTPEEFDEMNPGKYNYIEQLEKIGAKKATGNNSRFPLYLFPVQEIGGRMDTPADTNVRVYQGTYINHWTSGLVAMRG